MARWRCAAPDAAGCSTWVGVGRHSTRHCHGIAMKCASPLHSGFRLYSRSGNRVTTPTMERTERLAYRRGHGYRAVRLPYTSGLTALYVVLPDSGVSAVTVLDQFAGTGWPIPDPQKDARPVDLRL